MNQINILTKMMTEDYECEREIGINYKCADEITAYLNSMKVVDLKTRLYDIINTVDPSEMKKVIQEDRKWIRTAKKADLIKGIMNDFIECIGCNNAKSCIEWNLTYKQIEDIKSSIEKSMEKIDYTEAFYRGESDRLDQQQQFFQVEGQDFIRYTANGFINNISFSGENILENKGVINADSCNIVIDNMVLYSSNPDLNRFFPLKFQLGNEREIEFDGSREEITNYPVDKEINNGFGTLKTLQFTDEPVTNIISMEGNTASGNLPAYTTIYQDKIYTSILGTNKYYITDTSTGTVGATVTLPIAGNIIGLQSTDLIVVARQDAIKRFTNLLNNQFFDVGAPTLRNYIVFDDNVAILTYTTEPHRLRILNYNMVETIRYNVFAIPVLPQRLYTIKKYQNELFWFSVENTFYRGDVDPPNIFSQSFLLDKDFGTSKVDILNFEYQDSIQQITAIVREVTATFFVTIYAFQVDVRFIPTATIIEEKVLYSYQDTAVPDNRKNQSKTYRNYLITKMPDNSSLLSFVNIVDFSSFFINVKNYYDVTGEFSTFAISDKIFTASSLINNSGIGNNFGSTSYSVNSRPVTTMYKYSSFYDERIFEYDPKKINFDLFIKEENSRQLEIFKIVLDYRLRYSNKVAQTDGQKITQENKKKIEKVVMQKKRNRLKTFFSEIPKGTSLTQILPLGEPEFTEPRVGGT